MREYPAKVLLNRPGNAVGGESPVSDSSRAIFTVDDSVGWKMTERLSDPRESLVEVFVVARVQDNFAAHYDSYGAIAVEFDFVGPIRSFGEFGDQGTLHWLNEIGLSFWRGLHL